MSDSLVQVRCPGCLELREELPRCPLCGWQAAEREAVWYLPTGTRLGGQYWLGKVLRHDAFGVRYLAWDLSLEMKLIIEEYLPRSLAMRISQSPAVTIYPDARDAFEFGLERFQEQARTLARCHHPNRIRVFNVLRGNGTAYRIEEYPQGLNFAEQLAIGGQLMYPQALNIVSDVLAALEEMHQAGLLHGKISPDAISIRRDGQAALLQCASAYHALAAYAPQFVAAPIDAYSAPEFSIVGAERGPWSDVYSVAATLYRALTGVIPPLATERLAKDELFPPSRLGIDLPAASEQVLLQALAVHADQRFASVAAFRQALSEADTASASPAPSTVNKPVVAPVAEITPFASEVDVDEDAVTVITAPVRRSGRALKSDRPAKGMARWPWLFAGTAALATLAATWYGHQRFMDWLSNVNLLSSVLDSVPVAPTTAGVDIVPPQAGEPKYHFYRSTEQDEAAVAEPAAEPVDQPKQDDPWQLALAGQLRARARQLSDGGDATATSEEAVASTISDPTLAMPLEDNDVIALYSRKISDRELENFIAGYVDAMTGGNLVDLMDYYANDVDYYGTGTISKVEVYRHKLSFQRRWPETDRAVKGAVQVSDNADGESKTIEFVTEFRLYSAARQEGVYGTERHTLTLRKLADGVKIVDERQQVQERNRF